MGTPSRPAVFIGSSAEGLETAKAIQIMLDRTCEVQLWSQGTFQVGSLSLEALAKAVDNFDFAVLVVTPDDTAVSRGQAKNITRDNVTFELGLFMGALGRDRTFMVFDRTKPPDLPSDLAGVTPATFEPHASGNLDAALGAPCTLIERATQRLGVRETRRVEVLSATTESVRSASVQMETLVRLLAQSRKVELDIIADQFGAAIGGDKLAEIRNDLQALSEQLKPVGLGDDLDALQREVAASPEMDQSRRAARAVAVSLGPVPTYSSQTVAEARVRLESALRRLRFTTSDDVQFADRNIEGIVSETLSSGELSVPVARQCLEFFRLSAEGSSAPLSDDEIVAFHTTGSLLASHVEYVTRVASVTTGRWGHELLFTLMRAGAPDQGTEKEAWASIATIMPEVQYDYALFADAMRRAASDESGKNWPASAARMFLDLIVAESDFNDVVRFRRDELRRVIRLYDRQSSLPRGYDGEGPLPDDLYYRWPLSWGKIHFNTPVTGHTHHPMFLDVADDLVRAEEAVRRAERTGPAGFVGP